MRETAESAALNVNAGTPAAARSWFSTASSCASAWLESALIWQPLLVAPELAMLTAGGVDDAVGFAAGGVEEAAELVAGGVDDAAGLGVAAAAVGPNTVNVVLA